jgi:hypothetical protein
VLYFFTPSAAPQDQVSHTSDAGAIVCPSVSAPAPPSPRGRGTHVAPLSRACAVGPPLHRAWADACQPWRSAGTP